ncbi:MAG: hypothetical protein A2648_01130 [Candidatus Lloydbacteria bacterium RIFCSPHIGHO2_01_FULL_41_20]|uniref:Uncharacterized protein n=1 Tax=Candidatus Lloydbacteria bacterium RIFCSPHIGHO2_01_FULL_41_20 TaxID=1798657 RepID=A0A1G2CT05_9BACT|nr:MAG: hypothetical protein A2648_01130 [Candidatus Lloydbacteria bacterium RIFCSPHIGHO2_01_FULL_41_20]
MDPNTLKNLIIRELGAEALPEEARDDLIIKIGENIMKRTTLAILKRLTIEEQNEFEKIAETGDYQVAYNFASSKIENFQEFIKNEALQEIMELKK